MSSWSWNADLAASGICETLPRKLQNAWTDEQRCSILLLKRFYENSWEEITQIFNLKFESHLQNQGFSSHGMLSTSIRAQWHEVMVRSGRVYRLAYLNTEFKNPSCSDTHQLLGELRHSAWKCGIVLKPRNAEDLETLQRFNRLRRRSSRKTSLRLYHDLKLDAIGNDAAFPIPLSAGAPTADAKIKIVETILNSSLHDVQMPAILFRCYDICSQGFNSPTGFAAPLQLNSAIEAPDVNSCEIIEYADRHFKYWEKKDSVLISTTSSFIWALHLARICRLRGAYPRIALIETRTVSNATRVYPANPLCAWIKCEERANFRYKGTYEYLIWQKIGKDAILADFLFEDLEKLCLHCSELNRLLQLDIIAKYKSMNRVRCSISSSPPPLVIGKAIGVLSKFLRSDVFMEASWLKDLILVIFQNWKITIYELWQRNRDFVVGLRSVIGKKLRPSQTFAGVHVPQKLPASRENHENRIIKYASEFEIDSSELLLTSAKKFLMDLD